MENENLKKFIDFNVINSSISKKDEEKMKYENSKKRRYYIHVLEEKLKEFQSRELELREQMIIVHNRKYGQAYQKKFLLDSALKYEEADIKRKIQVSIEIIGILNDENSISSGILINLDIDGILKALSSKKASILYQYTQKIPMYHLPHITIDQIKKTLNGLLNELSMQMDPKTYYIYPTKHQEVFDSLVFWFSNEIQNYISKVLSSFSLKPKEEFLPRIMKIIHRTITTLQISSPEEQSIITILMIRHLFGLAYSLNPAFFFSINTNLTSELCNKIKMKHITETDSEMLVKDYFMNNDFVIRAGNHLVFSSLYTNPIDSLYEISESLLWVKKGLCVNNKLNESTIVPFDMIFIDFVGAIFSSFLPDFESVSSFIEVFSPKTGLCAEFEYALSTLQASTMFIDTLQKEITQ